MKLHPDTNIYVDHFGSYESFFVAFTVPGTEDKDGMDWLCGSHFHWFDHFDEAEEFAAKVKAAGEINPACWNLRGGELTSYFEHI